MAIIITDACINCMACVAECPNTAIYEPSESWTMADGTKLEGMITNLKGQQIDANAQNAPVSDDIVFIVPDKCTNCVGFHDTPQCAAVCPIDCCVPDENNIETEEESLKKQQFLHGLT